DAAVQPTVVGSPGVGPPLIGRRSTQSSTGVRTILTVLLSERCSAYQRPSSYWVASGAPEGPEVAAPTHAAESSGKDVGERRGEPPARVLVDPALDVQARRTVVGPQLEEVRPGRLVRLVGLGERLDAVDLARRQDERFGAVVLDAPAEILDLEGVVRELAQFVVLAVNHELDDVLQHLGHVVGQRLQALRERLKRLQLVVRREAEPVVEV